MKATAPLLRYFGSRYPNFDELNPKQKTGIFLGCEDNQSLKKVGTCCSLIREVFGKWFSMSK